MTLSLSAQRRASASYTNRQFRIFAGPPERFVNAALFVAGEPVTLPVTAYTTALVAFGTEPIDITLNDASGFPNTPNVLNLKSVRGSTWFRYESIDGDTLEDCTLIYGTDSHFTGAVVNQWVEISERVELDSLSGQDTWDGAQTVDWTWSLSGVNYNSHILPKDGTILIMQSQKGKAQDGNKWDDYVITAFGYCRNWDSTGDAQRRRRWGCTVESISTYINTYQVRGRVFGRVNAALGQPVTASANLANPLDLIDLSLPEWITGIGTTDADKLTDGYVDSGPYVSAVQPSQTPENEGAGGASTNAPGDDHTPGVKIEEVFLGDEANGNLQWFQLRLAKYITRSPDVLNPYWNSTGFTFNNDQNKFAISTRQTIFVESNVSGWAHEIPSIGGATNYIRLNNLTLSSDNPVVIFTNNRNLFLDRYHTDVEVRDWRIEPGFANDRSDDGTGSPGKNILLDRDGDWLQIRYVQQGIEQTVRDMLPFGAVDSDDWWYGDADDQAASAGQWSGVAVATPDLGNSIRRYPVNTDTHADDDWIEEEFPNPADRRTDTDNIYMSVELGDIPTALSEDITDSIALEGSPLPLSDGDYLIPTTGRYLVVRIDTEQMLLRQASDGTWFLDTRAYNSTAAAAHTEGTPIYYEYGEEFIRLQWIESAELRRWERYDRVEDDGDIIISPRVPGVWEIWGSREASPLYPGDENYRLDWVGTKAIVINQSDNDPSAWNQRESIPIQPLKHLMIVGKRMKTDSTYWMCNELRVWRAGLSNASGQYPGIGGAVYYYLSQLLDDEQIVIDDDVFTNTSGDITIQGGALGQILQDLGKQYGFLIRYTRDNKVHIKRNPFHPRAIRPDFDITIDPYAIEGTLTPQRANYPSRLGNQYVVNLHNTEAMQIYTGVYPPVAPFGDIVTIDLTMKVGNQTEANHIAQMYYLADPQISRHLSLRIVGALPEAEPLQRHLVFDYTDDAVDAGRWVDCLVKGVSYSGGYETLEYQEGRQA